MGDGPGNREDALKPQGNTERDRLGAGFVRVDGSGSTLVADLRRLGRLGVALQLWSDLGGGTISLEMSLLVISVVRGIHLASGTEGHNCKKGEKAKYLLVCCSPHRGTFRRPSGLRRLDRPSLPLYRLHSSLRRYL